MKFSFIIPALNEEGYIGDCIRSIRKQTEKPDEIIVVDNGSTDKTAEIAKRLGSRVVYEKRKGISYARNKGAKVAKGDILCFIDADGVLSGNWMDIVRGIMSNDEVQVADGMEIFSCKSFIKKIWYNVYVVFIYTGIILSQVILSKHFLTGKNTAIRKELFKKLGGFEPVVDEQVWLSRKLWKLPGIKTVFSPKMIIYSSSRGFDKVGYLRTIFYWAKASLTRVTQDGYHYQSKK